MPGWLTHAFLESIENDPIAGITDVRGLVQDEIGSASRLDIETVSGDLRDSVSLASALSEVDLVLHAAGILHVRRTSDWYDVNTRGTERLVEAAIHAGVRRMVFISSNAAAGRAAREEQLLTEQDPPQPRSHYGRSKLLAERALLAQSKDIEAIVLRPCMFYGPPVPKRHVEVYRRILTGRMPLVGDGRFTRSLTYIDNLVQACRLALTNPRAPGQTYYIADREPYTTRSVTEAMAASLGVVPRFLRLPRVAARVAYQIDRALAGVGPYWQQLHLLGEADWNVGVSINNAERDLGYAPAVALDEGMRRAVEWCRERRLV